MVFGLFSKEKSLQRTIERATNKLAQQADRWGALEKLREDGTDEVMRGWLRSKRGRCLTQLVRR